MKSDFQRSASAGGGLASALEQPIVVDDVLELMEKQPQVQGVKNRSRTRDREIGLELPIAVER